MHVAAPARLYCPVLHWLAVADVDPEGHAKPALQGPLHWLVACPARPKRPGSQGPSQFACVAPGLPYRPAEQNKQEVAEEAEYCPAPQMFAVAFEEPAGQM